MSRVRHRCGGKICRERAQRSEAATKLSEGRAPRVPRIKFPSQSVGLAELVPPVGSPQNLRQNERFGPIAVHRAQRNGEKANVELPTLNSEHRSDALSEVQRSKFEVQGSMFEIQRVEPQMDTDSHRFRNGEKANVELPTLNSERRSDALSKVQSSKFKVQCSMFEIQGRDICVNPCDPWSSLFISCTLIECLAH